MCPPLGPGLVSNAIRSGYKGRSDVVVLTLDFRMLVPPPPTWSSVTVIEKSLGNGTKQPTGQGRMHSEERAGGVGEALVHAQRAPSTQSHPDFN